MDKNNKKDIPIVPGDKKYSEVVHGKTKTKTKSDEKETAHQEKKLLVVSTSITKDIDQRRFNSCYGDGDVRFQKFHGGKVRHIKSYVSTHVEEEKPDAVLLQMGGNDVGGRIPIVTIANDIVDIGLLCRSKDVGTIFVGGVTTRRNESAKEKIDELNYCLKGLCKLNNFIFIDNSNITHDNLYDGVHLNKDGVSILANNYLDTLNVTFDA